MSIALMPVFESSIIDLIHDFIPGEPDIEWETVYGSTMIHNVKHLITYGGGPEGGFVFFNKKRRKGWYKWHRDWFQPPKYEKIAEGQVAINWSDGVEKIGVLPTNWDELGYWENEDLIILDDDLMMQQNQ